LVRRIASCARSYVFGPITFPTANTSQPSPQLSYRQNRLCTSGINYLREMHAALLCHLSLRKCLFLLALRYLKE
ncbi:Crp/Fnr family transcriptional regulator, partial [Pseudomonas sp. S60]|uniref:hypothetical protein n=1 Tax=Pseudomonas sp. S60 TaxID=211124 RepID=UPI001F1773BA